MITPRLPVLALTLALAACEPASPPAPTPTPDASAAPAATVRFVDPGANTTLRQRRSQWHRAVIALLDQPDAAHLDAARQQWSALYKTFNQHYVQLAARACANRHADLLERLDRWPLYPAYVDALPAWPDSGIVNDPTLALSRDTLRQQQGATDDGEVALGFQPVWLLIAGVPEAPRQATDLQPGPGHNGERRRHYLRLATEQLESDLAVLGTEAVLINDDLHCALLALDRRLTRLSTHRNATDAGDGLYLPAHTQALLDATQPAAALAQLASGDQATLRAELENHRPGFQAALDKATHDNTWAPIAKWLHSAHANPKKLSRTGPDT
jgi:hypothetical protein